jgi:hypothetical protein
MSVIGRKQAIPQLHRLAILADAGYAEPMLEADRPLPGGFDLIWSPERFLVWSGGRP